MRCDYLSKEAKEKIIKLRAEGHSYESIANTIMTEFSPDKDITRYCIQEFIESNKENMANYLRENKQARERLNEVIYDTVEEFRRLKEEAWNTLKEMKEEGITDNKDVRCPHCQGLFTVKLKNFANYINLMNHLMKQIEHSDKVAGKIKQSGTQITLNFNDLTQKILKLSPKIDLQREKMGEIKINKRKKKKIYDII